MDQSLNALVPLAPLAFLKRNWSGLDDSFQYSFGLVGFLDGGDIARTHYAAVRKDGENKALEIVGNTIVAALEEGKGLPSAIERHGPSRAHSQTQVFMLPG